MKLSARIALSLLVAGTAAGAANAEYITLDARAFQPQYKEEIWTESSAGSLICTTGGLGIFSAQLRLPRASIIKQLSAWGGDQSANQDVQVNLVRVCQPESIAASPTVNTLLSITSDSSAGAYYTSGALNEQAYSTNTCSYTVVVGLGTTCSANLSLAKVRITYTDDSIFADDFD